MGILGNIEDIFTDGDIEVDNMTANDHDSLLRAMFKNIEGIYSNERNDPFKINIEGGKKTLYVTVNSSRPSPVFDMTKGCKVSDVINNVDEVVCSGWLNIDGDNDIAKYIAPVVVADKISVQAAKNVKDVTLIARQTDHSMYLPSITFYNGHTNLTNCRLEFESQKMKNNRLVFRGIPTFTNVSSGTVNYIQTSYAKYSDLIWDNPIFNKVFEFGYTIKGTNKNTGRTSTAKINSMSDLVKLVTSKASVIDTEWNEAPIRIKKGLKITDFLDVSKFKNLYMINISGTKIGMFFENTKHPFHKSIASYTLYINDIPHAAVTNVDPNNISLKYNRNGMSVQTKYAKYNAERISQIPVTDDGWMVVLYRVS